MCGVHEDSDIVFGLRSEAFRLAILN